MSSADLTELLRASRPAAPDALRERVRAIASTPPAPAPFARLRLPRLRLIVPALATAAVAAAALIAVVRPAHERQAVLTLDKPATADLSAQAPESTASGQAFASPKASAPTAAAGSVAPDTTSTGRAHDFQAQIGIEVEDTDALSAATKRATTIAQNLGGYVLSSQFSAAESGTASITLRIPTAKVQEAIAQLTGLGKITSQQIQIQDLQEQLDQLARQVAVLRGRIAHIAALLANPDLTSERRTQLLAQRASLQSELRLLRRQEGGISQQAALATIQLTLATKQGAGVPAPSSRARRTLDEAGRILVWEGVAVLYGLVIAGPLAVVGLLVWLGARTRRRGIERRLLDA